MSSASAGLYAVKEQGEHVQGMTMMSIDRYTVFRFLPRYAGGKSMNTTYGQLEQTAC